MIPIWLRKILSRREPMPAPVPTPANPHVETQSLDAQCGCPVCMLTFMLVGARDVTTGKHAIVVRTVEKTSPDGIARMHVCVIDDALFQRAVWPAAKAFIAKMQETSK